jgi:hypothetical protein
MMRGTIETYAGSGRLGWRIRFPSVNNSVIETLVIDRNQWDNLKTTDIGKEVFVEVVEIDIGDSVIKVAKILDFKFFNGF